VPRSTAGIWVVVLLALVSSAWVLSRDEAPARGLTLWTFARPHALMYGPIVEAWNTERSPPVELRLIGRRVLEHRMLSGFFAGVETADLIEVERSIAGRAFTGPIESVGFLDLTQRLDAEGIIGQINPPSLSPWTTRGRVFGIPHDVHPVMLAYRADLVERAGIDVSRIETWDDFAREMRPLIRDRDGDGEPETYPLAFWPTELSKIDLLILQGGGSFFDARGRATMDSDRNAELLARMVSWCVGPGRIAAEVPDFTMGGNELKIRGRAACFFFPDWMCDVWNRELPQMAGRLRLMPLPAWEPGGRRTSVWGGTMLAIPRTTPDPDAAWAFAKHLYLSRELARVLYREGDIITAVRTHWDDPVYDQPDPYFGGQAKGRMYVELAERVPSRTSSPYQRRAQEEAADAALLLLEHAQREGVHDAGALTPVAKELLGAAQAEIERQMARTAVFAGGG
jgi:arabinosaccharide transport system substrate-binding protein